MSDKQHSDLAQIISSAVAMVILSGYENEIYNSILSDWRKVHFNTMTRGGLRQETLWINFPGTAVLHDYSYLGKDKSERQRIKRKIERIQKRLRDLPALERNAILASFASMEDENNCASGAN